MSGQYPERRDKLQRAPHAPAPPGRRDRPVAMPTFRAMRLATRFMHARTRARSRRLPPELTDAIVRRAFRGDPGLYRRFLATLRECIGDADIVLRGSAVTGESYRDHERFDARGPGSSDLDIVLVGPDAFRLWVPDAFYLAGVNTIPLSDHSPWVAPGLEPARRAAQDLVGRPVNIQAMARWFLALRAIFQVQKHVTLTEPE